MNPRLESVGNRVALVATLALPLLLIHARGVAEGVLAALAGAFLLRCALRRDFAPFRAPWFLAALGFWGWLLLCTLLNGAAWAQMQAALGWVRIPLSILAFSAWVLADAEARRWLLRAVGLAVAWIVLEVWLQLLAGRGILGHRRWPAGELPGPFTRPRAGPFLVISLWPPVLEAAGRLLRGSLPARLAAWALVALTLATLVFIGQRLPLVFGLFGFGIAALLMRGLLGPALLAAAIGAGALAASAVVAPDAFNRLAVQFPRQVANFPDSHYGQILARGLEMARQNPAFGLGANGFRLNCADPAYHAGWAAGSDGGGAGMCVIHAHNPYLEALTSAGWPGLLLFAGFALLLLAAVFRGLRRGGAPLRIGLFIATLIPLWPLSSGSTLGALPNGGMWVLLAGWGLALARAEKATPGSA
ncbi:O-antigen ligase family protein [Falsiroseomonas sp. E2-1-a20]|uniref:O-antigen ligase family protein n=1 Tax=Falsiroseomonas sp. E2-1-a20 TaxID=3239300 RepID=UPI003F3609E9